MNSQNPFAPGASSKTQTPRSPFFPPLIATLITGLAALVTYLATNHLDGTFWQNFPLGKAGLNPEYCELNRMEAFIRQPANTWSNLCYLFLGTWLIVWAIQDHTAKPSPDPQNPNTNPTRRFPALTAWVGLMLVGLCFGSFWFHASLTQAGQHWDMGFAYGLGVSLGIGAAYRVALSLKMKEGRPQRLTFLVAAILGVVLMFLLKWMMDGRIALPAVMLSGVVLAIWLYFREKGRFSGRILILGLLAIVLAGATRSLDLAKVDCNPIGWGQWHAAWHLCTGLAGFFFLAFLREEKP